MSLFKALMCSISLLGKNSQLISMNVIGFSDLVLLFNDWINSQDQSNFAFGTK